MSNKSAMVFKAVAPADISAVCEFYDQLPPSYTESYLPHAFEEAAFSDYFQVHYRYRGYLAIQKEKIAGYVACYMGHFEHDMQRFNQYSFPVSMQEDAQFAPIVHPDYQGSGLAKELLQYATNDLSKKGINRLFLWGGVNTQNTAAIKFYRKNGFQEIGQFEHNGKNLDMYLPIA